MAVVDKSCLSATVCWQEESGDRGCRPEKSLSRANWSESKARESIASTYDGSVNVENIVDRLSEVYHPVFGHPELSSLARRESEERLEQVLNVHNALVNLHGRPLKVLDLGCALGYFSFNLAQLGAEVIAIDADPVCVELCRELSNENPTLSVRTLNMTVEESLAHLEGEKFDLVLGLSIFHHIAHAAGFEAARALVRSLVVENSVLVCELAEKEEPVYWAEALPENPASFFDSTAFVVEIGRFGNHLSSSTRGLWVASDSVWVLGSTAGFFDSFSEKSHEFAGDYHQGTRKYFFGPETVLKKYTLGSVLDQRNLTEVKREVEYLANFSPSAKTPELIFEGKLGDSYWIAQSRLNGYSPLEGRRFRDGINPISYIESLIDELEALEGRQLLHTDIRSWNTLVTSDGDVTLVDFGAVVPKVSGDRNNGEAVFRFLCLALEVFEGMSRDPDVDPWLVLSPASFPESMQSWVITIMEHDAYSLNFSDIAEWFRNRDSLRPSRAGIHETWLDLFATLEKEHKDMIASTENSYESVHEKRYSDTRRYLERFAGFFHGRMLSLGSYGQFENKLMEEFPGLDIEVSDWDLRYPAPGKDGDYSAAIALEVVEHIEDQEGGEVGTHTFDGLLTMLCETNRLLKDGGFFAITTPNLASRGSLARAYKGRDPYIYWPHPRELAPFQLEDFLGKAGFEVIAMESFSPYPEDKGAGILLKVADLVLGFFKRVDIRLRSLRGSTLFVMARKISSPEEVLLETDGVQVRLSHILSKKPRRVSI